MSSNKNSKNFVAVIDQDKIEPEIARETVINYDPLNRAGKEGGFYIDENEELHIDDDDVMEAHKMAANKYPYDGAIKIVQLDFEEGEKVHQFGENSFRLYGLPSLDKNHIIGILGENGIGKSTALDILSGKIKPNLGDFENPPGWKELKKHFRGTELQTHFEQLSEDDLKTAYKPQQVEQIPKVFDGKVKDLLKNNQERIEIEEISKRLDVEKLLDRKISELSGGELQRVAIVSTLLKDADLYIFDEPSSFLDVKQRLNLGREIRKLSTDYNKKVIVVEHDLATLDLIADHVHIFHGEPGNYGKVTNKFTSKDGINQYLDGHIPTHNLKIRTEPIKFDRSKRKQVENKKTIFKYPELQKDFGENKFELETNSGELHEEEIMAIFGENGLGKTVFAKMLAGALEPDNLELDLDISIGYKPQYLEPRNETVYEAIAKHTNPESKKFETRLAEPLDLESLYENNVDDLSGGELQKVAVAITLSQKADLYLLDEPSAFLDVEARINLGKTLKRFARKTEKPIMIIDHDLLLLDYLADTGTVFKGEPGIKGENTKPYKIGKALNQFLEKLDITYRKDPETGRPRANKPNSQKDKEQQRNKEYYEK